MAGARAEIQDAQRRQLEFLEPSQQLVAHALLQRRGGVITRARAIEGLRDGAAIERKASRGSAFKRRISPTTRRWPRSTHPPAIPHARRTSVTRSRAVPAGTVGGRIALTRKPRVFERTAGCQRARASSEDHGEAMGETACRADPATPCTRRASASTLLAPPRFPLRHFQRRARGRGHGRRQRRRIDVRAGFLHQEFDEVRIAGDERAEGAEGLAEGADQHGHVIGTKDRSARSCRGPLAPTTPSPCASSTTSQAFAARA